MTKILPAVLSNNIKIYQEAFRLFETFPGNTSVHIDFIDGKFLKNKTAELDKILKIQTPLYRYVHLMSQKPIVNIKTCLKYNIDEISFHPESDFGDPNSLKKYKNIKFNLALGPEVKIEAIKDLLSFFQGVLILTVSPGKQGNKFLKTNLKKITELRELNFKGKIMVDGGVNTNTIKEVMQYKPDELIIGSGIIKQRHPIKAYLNLKEKIKQFS
ncbi:hypothetical protein GF362_02855 [Candidatus Dojkabacteria bacterium]|nr:hypothetical protein [Candidatus Dojkabacteria bacterium]